MAPFLVHIVATILARWVARSWRDAIRVGLEIMFLFTAASHFSDLKHDLAAMIPPPLTGELWVIASAAMTFSSVSVIANAFGCGV